MKKTILKFIILVLFITNYSNAADDWTQQNPAANPSARDDHAMAYIDGDQVLLFGGYDVSYDDETWVYDLSENSWTQKSPTSNPSARSRHAMAYIGSDQVLLFGGNDGSYDAETWLYDKSENNWTQKNPAVKPTGRYWHAMAYIGSDQVLLFGGNDGSYDAETWLYDLSENSWTQKSPVSNPSGRWAPAMAYIGGDQVLLFGGLDGSNDDETWIYDLSDDNWTHDENTSQPSARHAHGLSETSMDGSSYLVLFGGYDGSRDDETWTFGGGDYSLPVELTSFSASAGDGQVTLEWITESELNNFSFILERSEDEKDFKFLAEITGQGNTSSRSEYSYKDENVLNGQTYYYRLADRDLNGKITWHSTVQATPNFAGFEFIINNIFFNHFVLHNNFPNPFNPQTNIRFDVPTTDNDLKPVKLQIFNSIGQLVETLFDGQVSGGQYELKWNAADQPSGIYFIHFQSENFVQTRKMVLLR